MKMVNQAFELIKENIKINSEKQEVKDLLQSLNECIVVIEDKELKFQNNKFTNLIERINPRDTFSGATQKTIDLKIFRLYRETQNNQD